MKKLLNLLVIDLCVTVSVACLKDDSRTIMLPSGIKPNIPSDEIASQNPYVGSTNTSISNIQYTTENGSGYVVIRIDMTGIQIPGGDYLKLTGTEGASNGSQNVWVSVDGQPKGISVHNASDNDGDMIIKNDFIFLIDNSGSMGEESNAIARDIIDWAKSLSSKLYVRFGCVGYNGEINGAINITSYEDLSSYLNRTKGTDRTVGFSGKDASSLSSSARYYKTSDYENECGMGALHFANDLFSFRNGTNRIM